MARKTPPFTIGIEEEYLLVDRDTRQVATKPPEELFERCKAEMGSMVQHEFMASQIEIGTKVSTSTAEARQSLAELRSTVAAIAADYNLAPIASATHPFAKWEDYSHTDADRYNVIAEDLQGVSRRLLICGMHVHVGVGDDDEMRMDLMGQVAYFLPHLLALSTSSPYWRGEDTGMLCYRLSIFNELPRTGMAEQFDSYVEYMRHVDMLVHAGIIEDATKIWWDIRPSNRFPTLEMRICDVCTDINDAVAVASLYMCILRMLTRLKGSNQRWRKYSNMLIGENRWRAQRYGIDEPLIDFGKGALVDVRALIDELLELTREDAAEADCEAEMAHLRTIMDRGTSAHRQRKTYDLVIAEGGDHDAAMRAVVDMLIDMTATVE